MHSINPEQKNIVIAISLAIKPIGPKQFLKQLEWADLHSVQPIQILIVDEIYQYNFRAFNNKSLAASTARSLKIGKEYYDYYKKIICSLPANKQARFNIIRWQHIKSPLYFAAFFHIKKEFEANMLFQAAIQKIIKKFIKKRNRSITKKRLSILSNFLLEELPVYINGIYFDDIHYNTTLYPTNHPSETTLFVQDMQQGLQFKELGNKLLSKKNHIIESIIK